MKPKKDAGRVLVILGNAPWFLELFQELVDSYSQRPMSPHQRDLVSGSLWTNLIKLYTKCPDCVSEFKDKKGRELRDAYEKAFDKSRLLKPNGDIEPKKVHVIPKGKQVQMTMSGKSACVTVVKYKGAVYVAADAGNVNPDEYRRQHGKCPKGMHFDGKKCAKSNGYQTKVPVKHIMGSGVFPSKKRVQEFADSYGSEYTPKDHAEAAQYHAQRVVHINNLSPAENMRRSNEMEVHKSLHNYHKKKAREGGIKAPMSPWSLHERALSQSENHTKRRPGVP